MITVVFSECLLCFGSCRFFCMALFYSVDNLWIVFHKLWISVREAGKTRERKRKREKEKKEKEKTKKEKKEAKKRKK